MEPVVAVLLIAALVGVPALVLWRVLRGRRELGSSPAERATFETLHTASLAAPPLRAGLTEAGTQKASRHLRELLGSPALAITDEERLLVYDGEESITPARRSRTPPRPSQVDAPGSWAPRSYRASSPSARSGSPSWCRSSPTAGWSARSRPTAGTPRPVWSGPPTRWRTGSTRSWSWPSWIDPGRG
ncbi:hypothetical protein ACFQX6_64240 [Streptosporangium lutulentum]